MKLDILSTLILLSIVENLSMWLEGYRKDESKVNLKLIVMIIVTLHCFRIKMTRMSERTENTWKFEYRLYN